MASTSNIADMILTFPQFSSLPYDVRRLIWLLALEPYSTLVPQAYWFHLKFDGQKSKYMGRIGYSHVIKYSAPRSGKVYLQPNPAKDLAVASTVPRTVGAACSESRQIVTELLPNTLSFRENHDDWVLRFNASRDIIVLNACWSFQRLCLRNDSVRRNGFEPFREIQNLGIESFALRYSDWLHPVYINHWCYKNSHLRAPGSPCEDACVEDTVPRFVGGLFPALRTFYLTQSHSSIPRYRRYFSSGPMCACGPDSSPPGGHKWPLVRGMGGGADWYVEYDESATAVCPPPKDSHLERNRRSYRAHFPYYKALSHLKILYLRQLQSEGNDE